MRGNRLIKKIKDLQRRYGHDVEILLHSRAGLRDIDFDINAISVRSDVNVMFGTIIPLGDTYMSQEHIIHDIMSARHYGRYRGYENCPTFPCLSPQEQLAAVLPVRRGVRFNDDREDNIPF